MINATPRPLYSRERPGTHCIGGWVGLRAGLDRCGKSRPPPGFDPRTVQPIASRYPDWANPAHGRNMYGTIIKLLNSLVYCGSCWFSHSKYYSYINFLLHETWFLDLLRWFLGAFAKLRKVIISVMSVCLSAWNNSAPTGRIFMKFGIWGFFRKTVQNIHVSLKYYKNNGYFTWRPIYIFGRISLISSYNDKCFRQNLYRKSKHPFYVLCTFFFSENRAVYEIMWKNTVERGRPQTTIWRMRIAC